MKPLLLMYAMLTAYVCHVRTLPPQHALTRTAHLRLEMRTPHAVNVYQWAQGLPGGVDTITLSTTGPVPRGAELHVVFPAEAYNRTLMAGPPTFEQPYRFTVDSRLAYTMVFRHTRSGWQMAGMRRN